jgi:hypothetical protein
MPAGPNQPSRSRLAAIGCGSARRAACHPRGRFGSLCLVLESAWAGLILGQDLLVDQAFQFGADALGVLGLGADLQGAADVFGSQAAAVRRNSNVPAEPHPPPDAQRVAHRPGPGSGPNQQRPSSRHRQGHRRRLAARSSRDPAGFAACLACQVKRRSPSRDHVGSRAAFVPASVLVSALVLRLPWPSWSRRLSGPAPARLFVYGSAGGGVGRGSRSGSSQPRRAGSEASVEDR